MLKLPNADQARIERAKVLNYLLSTSHPDGRSKAAFFSRFGFGAEQWQSFITALRDHGANNEIVEMVVSDYGTRYSVDGMIETPDGRNPYVRTVWIIDTADSEPRLVTAYPLRREHARRT